MCWHSAGSIWRARAPTRKSPPKRAFLAHLRSVSERFRTSAWLYPLSRPAARLLLLRADQDRNADQFSDPAVCERPVRGDTRLTIGRPRHSTFGKLVHSRGGRGHGALARNHGWAEAGSAIGYISGHMLPTTAAAFPWRAAWGIHCAANRPDGSPTPLSMPSCQPFRQRFPGLRSNSFRLRFCPKTLRSQLPGTPT